jgi:hypothetical protein
LSTQKAKTNKILKYMQEFLKLRRAPEQKNTPPTIKETPWQGARIHFSSF